MCSRNIFKKNECCRLVWAALSLGSVRNSIYLHALASCFGLLSMPLACHVQQWHSNRAGSQAPLPLDQHGLSQLCSSVRPWQLAYAEMGVIGSTWVCDEGQMFWAQAWCWSLFCVAGVELVLARLRRQVNTMKECRFMVKSTSFWSWLALSFSSGFVTPVGPLASNNSKSQSW